MTSPADRLSGLFFYITMINITDTVCVKLTRRGSFLLNEHYKNLNLVYNMNNKVDWKADSWWCERLWVVVTTFQHYFKTTAEPPWTELVVHHGNQPPGD